MCDLLDGLEAIPDSQWRAWALEHDPPKGDGSARSERLRLSWLGFGQNQLLLLQVRNLLDSFQALAVAHWGGKTKPEPVLPPGVEPADSQGGRVDGEHVTSLSDYMAAVRRCFSG